jgi:hypothetical protein
VLPQQFGHSGAMPAAGSGDTQRPTAYDATRACVSLLVCVYVYQVGLITPCGITTPSLLMMNHDG